MAASVTSAAVATTSAATTLSVPPQFKIVGIILALLSGLLIGSSFVFKKKGRDFCFFVCSPSVTLRRSIIFPGRRSGWGGCSLFKVTNVVDW
jgi:hypothetical protein